MTTSKGTVGINTKSLTDFVMQSPVEYLQSWDVVEDTCDRSTGWHKLTFSTPKHKKLQTYYSIPKVKLSRDSMDLVVDVKFKNSVGPLVLCDVLL